MVCSASVACHAQKDFLHHAIVLGAELAKLKGFSDALFRWNNLGDAEKAAGQPCGETLGRNAYRLHVSVNRDRCIKLSLGRSEECHAF